MVTIEHNGEKVECSESDAIKVLRKMKATAKKKENLDAENRDIADYRAYVALAKLINDACSILDDNSRRYFEIATQNSGFGYQYLNVETSLFANTVSFVAQTEHGTAKVSVYGKEIIGCIYNGAEFLCAIQTNDKDEGEKLYSVGVNKDKVSLYEIPSRIAKIIVNAAEKRKAQKIEMGQ